MSITSTAEASESTMLRLVNGKSITLSCSNEASEVESIPTIDVSRMYSHDLADRRALAEEIGSASRHIGFFMITNHVSVPTLQKEAYANKDMSLTKRFC